MERSCGKEFFATSGCSQPRATRVARWGRRLPDGIFIAVARASRPVSTRCAGVFLGPSFDDDEIRHALNSASAAYEQFEDDELLDRVAQALSHGAVVGWFDGCMEFGPRALGARSIIGDARDTRMQSVMNLKIKYRESFRPFAAVGVG